MLGSSQRQTGTLEPSPSGTFLSRRGHNSMSIAGRSAGIAGDGASEDVEAEPPIGSIRFVPHVEFSSRLSLNFEPMERRVSNATHMKVGRFNEKSNNKSAITFKSKVVSRLHAEIWCENGTWCIKDAKSSSGTFVNHIRLSPPGQESKPVALADGDSVQFGIDFRGGTEEVYRCVRTKVEINRIFQTNNDAFNRSAHRKLKSLTTSATSRSPAIETSSQLDAGDDASTYSSECCICLFAIAPSQALFVAPCSHAYHFKCIRPLILQHYPNFLCCICRKYADLEASVEVESEAWIQSQAKDSDPRTPTFERDEPQYQSMNPATSSPTPQTPGSSANPAITPTSQAPIPAPDSGTPAVAVNRLVQDLSLEPQLTPVNHTGPFLINTGLE